MAIKLESIQIHRWTGLSTDTKPTEAPIGSTFYEYDTGKLFITYDGASWALFSPPMGHNKTGISDGRKTVSAAAAEALASSTLAKVVIITAETDNTGVIVVGGSTVVALLATRRGTPLFAGDSIVLEIDNLADVYLDTTVSGDGVTYTYLT